MKIWNYFFDKKRKKEWVKFELITRSNDARFSLNTNPDKPGPQKISTGNYIEKDNMGTRQETLDQAVAYWRTRNISQNFVPYVLYIFDNEYDACSALIATGVIHRAKDTGKLICTETLIFGCYPMMNGTFEAIVCGADLTYALYMKAKDGFKHHHGKWKNDQAPEKNGPTSLTKWGNSRKVKFVRKDYRLHMDHTMVYYIYKAPDAASAKEFLAKGPVTKQFCYLIVETPEGNYCRDTEGMYKE